MQEMQVECYLSHEVAQDMQAAWMNENVGSYN